MIDHKPNTAVDEPLDPVVARAATLLRRPEPVRQAWRDDLLVAVSTAAANATSPVRMWIPLGIAAALCAAVGIRRHVTQNGGDRVRFSVAAPSAKQVSLVGDFNRWNPGAVPMRRGSSDVWVVDVRLQPGRHVFAFSIDGGLRADRGAAGSRG